MELSPVRCKKCGRLLFKAEPGGKTEVEVNCERCGRLWSVTVSGSGKSKFKLLERVRP